MRVKRAQAKKPLIKHTNVSQLIELSEVLKTVDPSSSQHRTNLSRFNFKVGELNSEKLTNYGSKIRRSCEEAY